MKCDICGSVIDGKYAIYMNATSEIKHACKPCLRKIEKGIITTDMKYIRNDTYEPLVRKFKYRDFDIIGIPNLILYRNLVHRLSRYKDGITKRERETIVQFTEKEGIV